MKFQQILDDEKTFADGIELTINNEKVTLGDLRDLSRSKQKELSSKMEEAERNRTNALQLAEKAAEIKGRLEQQLEAAGKTSKVVPTDDEFDSDPFFAPVRKRFEPILNTQKELQATVKQLTDAMTRATSIWAEDRWQGQYERAKPRLKDKAKDWTYEKVRDYAATNKLFDSFGLPSVDKAILELTKEDEKQAAVDEAFQRGMREGQTKGRLGVMPRPTSASGGKPIDTKAAVAEKGLEGLGDDIAQDSELMEMLSQLGAIDPSEMGGPVQ